MFRAILENSQEGAVAARAALWDGRQVVPCAEASVSCPASAARVAGTAASPGAGPAVSAGATAATQLCPATAWADRQMAVATRANRCQRSQKQPCDSTCFHRSNGSAGLLEEVRTPKRCLTLHPSSSAHRRRAPSSQVDSSRQMASVLVHRKFALVAAFPSSPKRRPGLPLRSAQPAWATVVRLARAGQRARQGSCGSGPARHRAA